MKFKDFTQEAYDDIQSYMGGEEQWEEINKTYGVVENKGIFQYDYESQLRNAATQYQRQNEEASNSVRRMFDNVNGVDDIYAARFRDEYMDLERFSTAIKELAALINVRSVENIYTMDCRTLKTKAGNIQAKVDSKITEYYKERFYSVDSNGKTVMNWDEINYEMRKEFVPDAEMQALVSVFPKLSTDDEEETIANIENMLRAGYGNAKDDEWIDNADLEDPKYYSVSVTNTFKRAVDIYKTSMDIIDYYSEKCAYRNDEISDEALEEMKEQYRVSSLFKAMVDSYPTIGVAYNGKNDGFTIHSDKEKNVTVSVCLKELPFDVSICKITDSNDREILDKYYNVKVTNGTINEKVGKENEKVNQIDAYGMVDNQIVSHVLPHGMIENTKQNLENQKEEEKTECRVFFDVTSNTLKGKIIDEAIGLSAVIINETVGDKINKANAAINYLNDLNAAYDENNENIQNNAEIDEAKDRLTETDFTCQDMIEDANYFGMDMEITRVGDTYICENITTDVEKVTKMVDAYNAQAKPKQQVSIKDLEKYARGAGDKNQREDDESYEALCRRVSNYIKYVIKN
ncbi:hypothetical protein [Agathobacter rectalis]|jgi:hypothetical protein|uniref:Uncharacterized protein n=2 Tax=Agathobacter rectalis TaxID=39491 RepID=A0A3E4LS04_9FIRM|nr:hypothetical protein [Agathobacter rectalis]RGK40134.1 hypothetical protein DXD13_14095 [Agathobacter rectalis]RGM46606.1 hypothetical protein DXC13_11735 [Agathobacter rectalis]RGM68112.1 hypothetical protein DXB99_15450 [Agathobacter rectalis]RGT75629.1 hypothetical protein DWX07_11455 [Agathobacter rectalis]RGT80169.1 hypothetical protein DWX06_11045 [Agathobacter rectalis]